MSWEWSRTNEKDLARFVTPEAVRWLHLSVNRADLFQQQDGRHRLVQAIYEALAEKQIRYAPEQYHPSEAIQRIRTPPEILEAPREGTCLDLAALFCGLCLGYDLLPWLVVIEGHALVAVSLKHGLREWKAFNRRERAWFETELLTDPVRLRELVDSGAYLLLECTGFARSRSLPDSVPEGTGRTKEGLMPFEQAIATGRRQLEKFDRPFHFAVDIAVAHYGWRIEPHTLAGQYLVKGITALPTDYSTRIQNFLTEYLGTPEQPVPFGGRETDLERLDSWLEDSRQPPYLLLAAPAGRGKSALLVRWSQQLLGRDDVEVIFFPVSIRFRTNLASVVFASIAARLAALHGDKVPGTPDTSVEIWRGIMADYLNRPLPDGRCLLVILDGVDEAADWEPGPDLFPFSIPPGIRVVLSARYLAGDVDASAWLRRLGWDRRGLAHSLNLHPLSRQGVVDVLTRIGFPLDHLGKRVDIVAELYRLSEGDPLLVRLYVDDLWARGEETARLQPEDLRKIKPGLEGFFVRWWEDQHRLWGDKKPLREPAVQELLNLLACALGPLSQDDVLRLARPDAKLTVWTLEEALLPLKRFIIGDGHDQGYAFSHPRLVFHFHGRLDKAAQQSIESYFLNWGKGTLKALNEKQIAPEDIPPYIIQYYSAHLIRAGCGMQDFIDLISEGWQQAWFSLDSSYAGFLHETKKVWQIAERANAESIGTGKTAAYLGTEIRCAFCQSSIFNLAANIPPELLLALVEKGVWTSIQGLAYAQQIPDASSRTQALSRLVPYLTELRRDEVVVEALMIATRIIEDKGRAQVLTRLAPYLPEMLLAEALALARTIKEEVWRVQALTTLAPHLQDSQKVLAEALTLARTIKEEVWRVQALTTLAPHLQDSQKVLAEALTLTRTIEDKGSRARALTRVARCLPESQQGIVLTEALREILMIREEGLRVRTLCRLLPYLSEPQRGKALAETLMTMAKMTLELQQDEAFLMTLQQGEAFLMTLQQGEAFLMTLQQGEFLMTLARTIEDKEQRAEILISLVPYLPESLLTKAFAETRQIRDEINRLRTLIDLTPYMPESLLEPPLADEALMVAKTIKGEDSRVQALTKLAPYLPESLLPEALKVALKVAESIKDKYLQAQALNELGRVQQAVENRPRHRQKPAPQLPERRDEAVAEAIMTVAKTIKDEEWQAQILSGLPSHSARLPAATLYPLWCKILPALANHNRENLLDDIHSLAPVIVVLGGEKAIVETFHAIRDVGRWWP
jgi:hypothetical protein